MIDPKTATMDECRQWLTYDDGWMFLSGYWAKSQEEALAIDEGNTPMNSHPFPSTLDAAARAMPDGWRLRRLQESVHGDWWCDAENRNEKRSAHPAHEAYAEADTELLARFRLAVACRLAQRTEKAP